MKYAVYVQNEDSTECIFFKTEEEAKLHISAQIRECEDVSEGMEKNLHWDITLLKVTGECHWTQDGLQLRMQK